MSYCNSFPNQIGSDVTCTTLVVGGVELQTRTLWQNKVSRFHSPPAITNSIILNLTLTRGSFSVTKCVTFIWVIPLITLFTGLLWIDANRTRVFCLLVCVLLLESFQQKHRELMFNYKLSFLDGLGGFVTSRFAFARGVNYIPNKKQEQLLLLFEDLDLSWGQITRWKTWLHWFVSTVVMIVNKK